MLKFFFCFHHFLFVFNFNQIQQMLCEIKVCCLLCRQYFVLIEKKVTGQNWLRTLNCSSNRKFAKDKEAKQWKLCWFNFFFSYSLDSSVATHWNHSDMNFIRWILCAHKISLWMCLAKHSILIPTFLSFTCSSEYSLNVCRKYTQKHKHI